MIRSTSPEIVDYRILHNARRIEFKIQKRVAFKKEVQKPGFWNKLFGTKHTIDVLEWRELDEMDKHWTNLIRWRTYDEAKEMYDKYIQQLIDKRERISKLPPDEWNVRYPIPQPETRKSGKLSLF